MVGKGVPADGLERGIDQGTAGDALRPGTGSAAQPSGGYRRTRCRKCWAGHANGAPFWGAAACPVRPELPSVHLFRRDRFVSNLPRHASRGWSRVGTPGLP